MRSAVLTSSISRNAGGLFYSVRNLHQHLALKGVDARVMALRDEFSNEDAEVWPPLAVKVHEFVGPRSLGYSPALGKSLESAAPDLVHVHGLWQGSSISSLHYCSKTLRPNVISPRGMLDPWAYRNARWKKLIAGALFEFRHLKTASCLNALCDSERRSMRDFGLQGPIAVVPNGVELPQVRRQEKKSAGQKAGRKVLLFLGRIHPKKGLVNALRAWKTATENRKGDKWQFVIAGWEQGEHEAELQTLCDELSLCHHKIPVSEWLSTSSKDPSLALNSVLFVGPVYGDQKDSLLRQADAFILSSFSEGLPMSVLEAWAYELPVLMTEQCNIPEGFAAEAAIRIGTDPESIAEGLRWLVEASPSERRALGQNGRALVEQRFTWPQVAAQMKEVYEWVLGGGDTPSCVYCD